MFAVCVVTWSLKDGKAHGRYVRRNRRQVDWLTENLGEARTWRTRQGAERYIRSIPDLDAEVIEIGAPGPCQPELPCDSCRRPGDLLHLSSGTWLCEACAERVDAEMSLIETWHRAEILAAQAS